MATQKTTRFNWDKPTFPSNNVAAELDALIDQIDSQTVNRFGDTMAGNLNLNGNDLENVRSIDSTTKSDAYIRTKGGGSDLWRFYDEANKQNIAEFREGGDVAIPNGGVVMGSFRIEENSSTNSLDFNYTG